MATVEDLKHNLQRLGNLERQRENLNENITQEEQELRGTLNSVIAAVEDVDLFDYKRAVRSLLEIWAVTDSGSGYEAKVRAIVGNWVSYFQSEVEDDE